MTARITLGKRRREIRAGNERIGLTGHEYEILWTMMTRPVVRRDDLIAALWPCAATQPEGARRAVYVLLCFCRRKLRMAGWDIRLVGYGAGWTLDRNGVNP